MLNMESSYYKSFRRDTRGKISYLASSALHLEKRRRRAARCSQSGIADSTQIFEFETTNNDRQIVRCPFDSVELIDRFSRSGSIQHALIGSRLKLPHKTKFQVFLDWANFTCLPY
jgi:hypothetical protein